MGLLELKWWMVVFAFSPLIAQAAPRGVVFTHQAFTAASTSKKLIYRGGPVISNAKIYAVMWGNAVDSATQTGIGGMLASISTSSYLDLLAQYRTTTSADDGRSGTQQEIGRGTFAGLLSIQPSISSLQVTDQQIGAELEHQIDIGVLPRPDGNTLYMAYFPPGLSIDLYGTLSCQTFCGYHHSYQSSAYGEIFYGVIADLGGDCSIACGYAQTQFEDVTVVTSHELAELVTDPMVEPTASPGYPDAWNAESGQEIGDECATEHATTLSGPSGTSYAVQAEYDNAHQSCASGPFESP